MSSALTQHLRTTTESRFEEDWARQRRTAADILQRLKTQEGVILADQVGMGKTYVALAVAVSQILSDLELEQVVIFVPSAVADKWVREWRKFSESLLEPGIGIRCVDAPVRSSEEFLKKLSDSPNDRKHIVVVTHTALTTKLKDPFVQLALLHYATRYVREGDKLRRRMARWCSGGDRLSFLGSRFTTERVEELLCTAPSKWRFLWRRLTGEDLLCDPVPAALENAARNVDLHDLWLAIEALPIRWSGDIERRLKEAGTAIEKAIQDAWKRVLSSNELELPLLIVDEAHRLKNRDTQISKLFGERSSNRDTGALTGIFNRMLFLTATPFELGHSELIEVLRRLGSVRKLEPLPEHTLESRLGELESLLTEAQATALSLDDAWGRLSSNEAAIFDAWGPDVPSPFGISAATREAWEHAKFAAMARQKMHASLKPWVIRHERRRRRDYYPGASILASSSSAPGGLQIPDGAVLPFLLAARAQSIALDEKGSRPLYAYGIASSFEAFRRLGSGQAHEECDSDLAKEDRESDGNPVVGYRTASSAVDWYRREIDRALAGSDVHQAHPKVRATVEKASQLWLKGEKCLIFCWFIKTGETVEHALASRIDDLILEHASTALGMAPDERARLELDRISDRLFRRDTSSYGRIRQRLTDTLAESAGHYEDVLGLVVDAAIRHLRTHSFLVRYMPLSTGITDEDVWEGINGRNPRGIALLERWKLFAERLARYRLQVAAVNSDDEHDSEFSRIKSALLGIEGEHDQMARRGASLHPVRRAHGGTERGVRERLIAMFNTPYSPDLLVASSVMGEGIDLHQECRFVIHHDLDWNPGVLEQRTGRLDRIGSLSEREERNIEVYEPYLAGTHDEKMYRVVKDRDQWFDIVMGRPNAGDEQATDAEEMRVKLHSRIRSALAMDLRSPDQGVAIEKK